MMADGPPREQGRFGRRSGIRLFGAPIGLILGAGVVGFGLAWLPDLLRDGKRPVEQEPEPPPDFAPAAVDPARLQAMAARRQEHREQADVAPAALEAIERYALAHGTGDAKACAHAAEEFASLGEPALAALRERLASSVQAEQTAVLLDLAAAVPGEGTFDLLREIRGRIPLTDAGVQEAWIVAISKAGGRSAVPVLALAWRDLPEGADPGPIGDGLLAVGTAEDAPSLRQMAEASEGERKERMLSIAGCLEASGRPEAPLPEDPQGLAAALQREEVQNQRILLIKRLAALGTPEAAAVLAEYARTAQRTPALRDAGLNAIDALCGMRGEGCRETLYALFENLGDTWQIDTARILEGRATDEDRPFLERWAGNPDADPRVRRAFRNLLESLGG